MGTSETGGQPACALSQDQRDRMWAWLLHEGNLFNGRQQLFAVAEAMLLGAYATMSTATKPDKPAIAAMGVVGAISCLMWLYANMNQIHRYIKPIRETLEPCLPEWANIRKVGSGRLRTTTVLGVLLPLMIAFLWLFLLSRL
jgi:hypothetical protein